MTLPFLDTLVPAGAEFPIVKDVDLEGGFMVVADIAARNAITSGRQKIGMHVHVQTENRTYRLVNLSAPPIPDYNWESAGDDFGRYGPGVMHESDSRNPTGARFNATTTPAVNDLYVDTGVAFDRLGIRRNPEAENLTNIPAGNYVVYINSNSLTTYATLGGSNNGIEEYQVPLWVIRSDGPGNEITILEDVRANCARNFDKNKVTVGERVTNGRGGNFPNLRPVFYYMCCFDTNGDVGPSEVIVMGDTNSTIQIGSAYGGNVNFATDPVLSVGAQERCEGIKIRSEPGSASFFVTELQWSETAEAAFVFSNSGLPGMWEIENIQFSYGGASSATAGLFKNKGEGLIMNNVQISGNNGLGFIAQWDVGISIGGYNTTTARSFGWHWTQVRIDNYTNNSGFFPFQFGAAVFGSFKMDHCRFTSTTTDPAYIFDMHEDCTVRVFLEDCRIRDIGSALFQHTDLGGVSVNYTVAPKIIRGGEYDGTTNWSLCNVQGKAVKVTDAILNGNVDFDGLYGGQGVTAPGTPLRPGVGGQGQFGSKLTGSFLGNQGGGLDHEDNVIDHSFGNAGEPVLISEYGDGSQSSRRMRHYVTNYVHIWTVNAYWDEAAGAWKGDNTSFDAYYMQFGQTVSQSAIKQATLPASWAGWDDFIYSGSIGSFQTEGGFQPLKTLGNNVNDAADYHQDNAIAAWGDFDVGGGSVTVNAGYNIDVSECSIDGGGRLSVHFQRSLSIDYGVQINEVDYFGGYENWGIVNQATDACDITGTANLSSAGRRFFIIFHGAKS